MLCSAAVQITVLPFFMLYGILETSNIIRLEGSECSLNFKLGQRILAFFIWRHQLPNWAPFADICLTAFSAFVWMVLFVAYWSCYLFCIIFLLSVVLQRLLISHFINKGFLHHFGCNEIWAYDFVIATTIVVAITTSPLPFTFQLNTDAYFESIV